MRNQIVRQRGYSLAEILTVVAIIGIVTLATIPAIFQLYPQYRIRNASSTVASTVRLARQNAIATRSPWRVTFDLQNDRFALFRLAGPPGTSRQFPFAPTDSKIDDIKNSTWWRPVDRRGMGHNGPFWTPISGADLRASTASPLFNVDCVGADATAGPEVVFLPNGAVARNPDCGDPSTDLDFVDGSGNELLPEIVIATDNSIIRFNRYAIRVQPSGNVVVVPGKE